MSKKTENELRGKNFVLFVVACLFILSFGFGGFVLGVNYDNGEFFHKQDKVEPGEETNKQTKIENLEITDSIVQSAFSKIDKIFSCSSYEFAKDKKVVATDLDEKYVRSMVYVSMPSSTTYTRDQFNDASAKIFGKGYSYPHGDSQCPFLAYDAESGIYTQTEGGCGFTCGPYMLMKKIVKAQKVDDSLEIYIRVLFPGTDESTSEKYYSDYNRTHELQLTKDYQGVPENVDSNYTNGGLYKIIFEKEDDYYYFVSSEPVK